MALSMCMKEKEDGRLGQHPHQRCLLKTMKLASEDQMSDVVGRSEAESSVTRKEAPND